MDEDKHSRTVVIMRGLVLMLLPTIVPTKTLERPQGNQT